MTGRTTRSSAKERFTASFSVRSTGNVAEFRCRLKRDGRPSDVRTGESPARSVEKLWIADSRDSGSPHRGKSTRRMTRRRTPGEHSPAAFMTERCAYEKRQAKAGRYAVDHHGFTPAQGRGRYSKGPRGSSAVPKPRWPSMNTIRSRAQSETLKHVIQTRCPPPRSRFSRPRRDRADKNVALRVAPEQRSSPTSETAVP